MEYIVHNSVFGSNLRMDESHAFAVISRGLREARHAVRNLAFIGTSMTPLEPMAFMVGNRDVVLDRFRKTSGHI